MSSVIAAVMPAPRVPVELREFAEPALAPGSALLRTLYSEVCGTDVHLWHGRLSGVPYPIIPGHVSIGVADRVRGEMIAVDERPVREGDRLVFFDVHRTCGRCRACTVARTPTRCAHRRVYGITDSAADGLFGGWAEAIYLEPGVAVARLPDAVPAEAYIGGGCGLITAVHILERAALTLGDTVLVQGTSRRPIRRGASSGRIGARRRGRAGPDSRRGRYVIAGHYTDAGPSAINVHQQINRKHLEIRGCWGSEVAHFVRALRILERHHDTIPWRAIGARTYALADVNQALADAEAMRLPKALVKPN
jgi:threonine dehydrogenase-like Zn-dependent dehydrogenase